MLEERLPNVIVDGLCISELTSHGNFINPDYPLSRLNIKENDTIMCVVMTKEDVAKKKLSKNDSKSFNCRTCCVTSATVCCCCLDGCVGFYEFVDDIMGCVDDVCSVISCCKDWWDNIY